jgi:hypothetical protein
MRKKLIIGLSLAAVPLLVFGVFLFDDAMAYTPPLQMGMTPAQVDQLMGDTPTGCGEPRGDSRCYYHRGISLLGKDRRVIVDFRGGQLVHWELDEPTRTQPPWLGKLFKFAGY